MASTARYDAIIVGGGHNGLIAAGYLAKERLKVLVLERRHIVGGACVTEELIPGYRVTRTSYVASLLLPEIIRDFRLKDYGFEVLLPEPHSFYPQPSGKFMLWYADEEKTNREVAKFSARDGAALTRFQADLADLQPFVDEIMRTTPPMFPPRGLRELFEFGRFGRRMLKLGEKRLKHFFELMTSSCYDYLSKRFESDEVMAAVALNGLIGTCVGPMTPGSAAVMLHHSIGGTIEGQPGAWGYVRGGMGGLANAFLKSVQDLGVEVKTNAEVGRFLIEGGICRGVALSNGDEYRARLVASNLDPRRTFLGLVDKGVLEDDFVQSIKDFRTQGSSIKVNCALSELPNWTAIPGQDPRAPHQQAMFELAPSIEYLERAYDDLKYGRPSKRPMIDGNVASTMDDTLCPKGRHVMSLFVQYGPYKLKEGTWPEIREKVGDDVIETLAEYAPNIKKAIIGREVLTPWDLEKEFGLTEGNIFHGEMTPDQLFFMRPAWRWAQYRTPIRGLYLCGSGAHPGGGVLGAPGRNAAREILRDVRR
ncbi:MAG TPA: NAD(P)/FAD-dependent oxidoreductase [Candidatus Polarisedimenticolia bacterium]|nr:NAD(P)/FAD-dependent oxidoreductase [Candidatus Polarisedimenticolia bacterium]